jgi:hypothetical protein
MTLIPLTNFPNSFVNGVTLRNVPVLNTWSGTVYWVDSNGPGGTYKGTFARPFATVAAALTAMPTTLNNVLIMVKAGHTETISAAGGWTITNTGTRIEGIGVGSERPQITFATATTASVLISGAGCTLDNLIGLGGIASLANPINIQAADATINIEWRDATSKEAVTCILGNASANNLNVNMKYVGLTGSSINTAAITLNGCANARINIDYYGSATTGVVNFITASCTNIAVFGLVNNTANPAVTSIVSDTIGSSTYTVDVQNTANGTWASYSNGIPSLSGWNYIPVTATFTSATWNTTAFHRILAVTGQVEIYITPFITTTLAGAAGTYILGDITTTNSIMVSSAVAGMLGGYVWSATTPVTTYVGGNTPGALHAVVNGKNIGYTIGTTPATAGVILFACYWRPLAPGGVVVAGGGQAS